MSTRSSAMSTDQDANVFALLSDTHIPESPEITARGVNMTANLQLAVKEVLEHGGNPSQLFINGDCAYLKGLPNDYANLARCLAPVEQAGINMHLSMGNHDDRQPLFDALSKSAIGITTVMSKHVSIVESEFANWFLLDSLFEVDVVTGEIGGEQLTWLGGALDARSDKPAIVMVHHNPQFSPPAEGKPWGGISDTADLFDVLAARSHVKAMMYGTRTFGHKPNIGELN